MYYYYTALTLPTTHCPLPTAHCPLPTAHLPPPTAHRTPHLRRYLGFEVGAQQRHQVLLKVDAPQTLVAVGEYREADDDIGVGELRSRGGDVFAQERDRLNSSLLDVAS